MIINNTIYIKKIYHSFPSEEVTIWSSTVATITTHVTIITRFDSNYWLHDCDRAKQVSSLVFFALIIIIKRKGKTVLTRPCTLQFGGIQLDVID